MVKENLFLQHLPQIKKNKCLRVVVQDKDQTTTITATTEKEDSNIYKQKTNFIT